MLSQAEMKEHWQRVLPVVGADLRAKRVAIYGVEFGGTLIECLSACGIGRWLLDHSDDKQSTQWQQRLQAKHGEYLAQHLTFVGRDGWEQALHSWQPDLVLYLDAQANVAYEGIAATDARVPVLSVQVPGPEHPTKVRIYLPGDAVHDYAHAAPEIRRTGKRPWAPLDNWGWITASYLVAGLARALLLQDTAYSRDDLARLWAQGVRWLTIGGQDPLDVTGSAQAPYNVASDRLFAPAATRRGSLLVVGLGSLGSVATRYLAAQVEMSVVADPARVSTANPVRQAYDLSMVGQQKANVLATCLTGQQSCIQVVPVCHAITSEAQVTRIVEEYAVTAALIATGTNADFVAARALHRLDIPHVVGRCYPRANYWEAMLIAGQQYPALDDLRGQIGAFPTAPLTAEQRAAYADQAVLEAEPATLIESGWAAAWMARLTHQLLQPEGLRERWMLELLGHEAICLIGGVRVQQTESGPAYAVAMPGQIRAWQRHVIHQALDETGH